jgi:hypothetical protein
MYSCVAHLPHPLCVFVCVLVCFFFVCVCVSRAGPARGGRSQMLRYGCTRLEIGVQSVYEDVARDTNRCAHRRVACGGRCMYVCMYVSMMMMMMILW